MTLDVVIAALKLLADPYVIMLILGASAFGLFVGAIPWLTAAMAIALLVPVSFFMATRRLRVTAPARSRSGWRCPVDRTITPTVHIMPWASGS